MYISIATASTPICCNLWHSTVPPWIVSRTATFLPLFLAHGTHTLKDIPQILGLEDGHKTTTYALGNKAVKVVYTEPLGVDPCIADLAFKRLKEA